MGNLTQIDFDFSEPSNRFMCNLKSGTFVVLFEVDTPARERDFELAVEQVRLMVKALDKSRGLETGLAMTDRLESVNSWNAAEFARRVLKEGVRDRHVVYVSGRGSSKEDIADMLGRCAEAGLTNVVPVSGEGYGRGHRQPCFDSCNTLRLIADSDLYRSLLPGCVVNPFKYSANDSFPQYFKLVKKLNFGAGFVVAQTGWDMMKHQELRWYLDSRELHYPTIARIRLLTPETVKAIMSGVMPGVYIPRKFGEILNREGEYGYQQFAAAQWRRMQLQAAGLALLGYSGIQIAGISSPEHMMTACDRIKEGIREFHSFEKWRDAYLNHMANSDMAPPEHRFYMFDNLFQEPHAAKPHFSPRAPDKCGTIEKLHYKLCSLIFSRDHLLSPGEHRLSKKLFAGCPSCSYCRLPLCHYICPETCPKGLANGPCGGSRPDSRCEIRDKPCIHERRTRLALWLNEVDIIEERHVRHPQIAAKSLH
ncbi:MAG: methylenetetrahydrofolate reductase C-terminal domain-containing protein [Victivallales bacterium]|nr:methylenetetrahydrofolate reductase C-terminal domain-containing protein [Victivallales bacterium]